MIRLFVMVVYSAVRREPQGTGQQFYQILAIHSTLHRVLLLGSYVSYAPRQRTTWAWHLAVEIWVLPSGHSHSLYQCKQQILTSNKSSIKRKINLQLKTTWNHGWLIEISRET
jgi:hypothetical protein